MSSDTPIVIPHPRMASNLPPVIVPSSWSPSISTASSQAKDPFKKPLLSLRRPHIPDSMDISKKLSVIQYAPSQESSSIQYRRTKLSRIPIPSHHQLSSSIISVKSLPSITSHFTEQTSSFTPSILPSNIKVSEQVAPLAEEYLTATEVSSCLFFAKKIYAESDGGIDQLPYGTTFFYVLGYNRCIRQPFVVKNSQFYSETSTCYRCHLCDEMVKK